MQYNLTEEQSTKFYNDLKYGIDLIDRIHEYGIQTFRSWYDDYVNNHKSWIGLKPMSIEKFGKKISLSKGIIIDTYNDKEILATSDGWNSNLRPVRIAKLTKNDYYDILSESHSVRAACIASMCRFREYDEWLSMIDKMEKYMQVPYTIDQEWLDVLEDLPKNLDYYKMIVTGIDK